MNGTITSPSTGNVRRDSRQVELFTELLAEFAEFDPDGSRAKRELMRSAWQSNRCTYETLRQINTELINALKLHRRSHAAKRNIPDVPTGHYAVDTDQGHLGFYHVTVGRNGYVTVKVYASDNQHLLPSWPAQLAVLRKIEQVGPLAASIRFGLEHRVCGVCGRKLTTEESRARGIGPVCAQRF